MSGGPANGNRRRGGPRLGLIEWLRPGEHERAEAICDDLARLGVTELRTHVSWADWHTEDGPDWYDWLIPTLARRANVLPCFMYTPPRSGSGPRHPPRPGTRGPLRTSWT